MRYVRGIVRDFYTGQLNPTQGCVSIHIGNWFSTEAVFLVRNVSPMFSSKVISSGLPLFASVRVDVVAACEVSAKEVWRWITGSDYGYDSNTVSQYNQG